MLLFQQLFLALSQHLPSFIAPAKPRHLDRLPYLPVQVLYLIAKALPQPSQVFNLARVNKATWDYLQPALYECEVTYEARLVARFGDGSINDGDGDNIDTENDEEGNRRRNCAHGLVTPLCEACGQPERIAIEDKHFKSRLLDTQTQTRPNDMASHRLWNQFKTPGMTALHWACYRGEEALPVARKAIKAAKAHQPAYINGQGLRVRSFQIIEISRPCRFGEIPQPLFTAVAFRNTKLCEELIEAGCNLNLLLGSRGSEGLVESRDLLFQIHESCIRRPNSPFTCQSIVGDLPLADCCTAGHVALYFKHIDTLGFLLDRELDPQIGLYPLMDQATSTYDLAAIKILLDRSPEMTTRRWDGLTCLHVLCGSSVGRAEKKTQLLQKLESVAAYLFQKGANLEAQAGGWARGKSPLQFAIWLFTPSFNSDISDPDNLYAAEVLINLGAVWNQPLTPTGSTDTILNYCVHEATLGERRGHSIRPRRPGTSLAFAKLVKAIIRSHPLHTPVPAPAHGTGSDPLMQAYLGAFKMLAVDREKVTTQGLNTFALEAVGRMLLSTGISPDKGDIEKWNVVIAGNAERQKADKWAASLWKELVVDTLRGHSIYAVNRGGTVYYVTRYLHDTVPWDQSLWRSRLWENLARESVLRK